MLGRPVFRSLANKREFEYFPHVQRHNMALQWLHSIRVTNALHNQHHPSPFPALLLLLRERPLLQGRSNILTDDLSTLLRL